MSTTTLKDLQYCSLHLILLQGVVETESKEREERSKRELTATKNSYKEALDDLETLKKERAKLVNALTAEQVSF